MSVIPEYQSLMQPILEILSDGKKRNNSELSEELATRLGLTNEQRTARHKSVNGDIIFIKNTSFALSYLFHAELLE